MPKGWEPKRATCKHCKGRIYQTGLGNWVHLDHGSIYCEVQPPKAEPELDEPGTVREVDPDWLQADRRERK